MPNTSRDSSNPRASVVVRTILVADIADSTKMVQAMGDVRGAELIAQHDRIMRGLIAQFGGEEVAKSDGFVVLFDRPIDAISCSLELHAALASLPTSKEHDLKDRVGVHMGEIVRTENPVEEIARGAKTNELAGLAIAVAARLMSVGLPGQTLVSMVASTVARRSAVGEDSKARGASWLAHGLYSLKGIDEPMEIFEVGIEGISPLKAPPSSEKVTRAVVPGDEYTLGWRPSPGAIVPMRPHWVVVDKLGEGGFGEAWLVRNDNTRENRVFKFCFQRDRLRALKREAVFFRLLTESFGHRNDIVRMLDIQFEEAPFFIELEYTQGGNLADWIESQGGIETIPLATRLDIVAQVADAVAAAHSVAILHKDIKPSNILVERGTISEPRVQLTDFGIGMLMDKSSLKTVDFATTGITELNLLENESSRTGTRLYAAPELLEGKGASIQSDIYSLGVLLYQLASGRMTSPLAPGWERDIADPLLRDDVAACVAGRSEERLASAAELATRLRSLASRRRQLFVRKIERAGAFAFVLFGVLAIVGLEGYRRELDRSTRMEYLSRQSIELAGLLLRKTRPLLDHAAALDIQAEVSNAALKVFSELPPEMVGTNERWALSMAHYNVGTDLDRQGNSFKALPHYEQAVALARSVVAIPGFDSPDIWMLVQALTRLGETLDFHGKALDGLKLLEEARTLARKENSKSKEGLGVNHAFIWAQCEQILGSIQLRRHEYASARKSFQMALTIRSSVAGDTSTDVESAVETARVLLPLCIALQELGEFAKAEELLRDWPRKMQEVAASSRSAMAMETLGNAHFNFGVFLANPAVRKYEEAMEHLTEAEGVFRELLKQAPDEVMWTVNFANSLDGQARVIGLTGGNVLIGQEKLTEAIELLNATQARVSDVPRFILECHLRVSVRLAWILSMHGVSDAAVRAFDAAVQSHRRFEAVASQGSMEDKHIYADEAMRLSRAAKKLGRANEADELLKLSLESCELHLRDSSSIFISDTISQIYMEIGQVDRVRQRATRLLDLGWGDPDFLRLCELHGIKPSPKSAPADSDAVTTASATTAP